jgi:hypothetical protein
MTLLLTFRSKQLPFAPQDSSIQIAVKFHWYTTCTSEELGLETSVRTLPLKSSISIMVAPSISRDSLLVDATQFENINRTEVGERNQRASRFVVFYGTFGILTSKSARRVGRAELLGDGLSSTEVVQDCSASAITARGGQMLITSPAVNKNWSVEKSVAYAGYHSYQESYD